MKDPKKAKWIIGTSGVVLSAFLLTQIGNTEVGDAGSGKYVSSK